MQYKPLSSIFYSNNNEYLKIYTNRYNSESTYRFDFKIKENNILYITKDGRKNIYDVNLNYMSNLNENMKKKHL